MIYHISTEADWEKSKNKDVYEPGRFDLEGFIHCSTNSQIERIANSIFRSYSNVWLLFIDDKQEHSYIKYENLEGGKELFPHIYRKLPHSSIIKAELLTKSNDDLFVLPFS